MERNLKVTRIYKLGEFQNIQFTDEIIGIPENLMLEPEFIEGVRAIQFLGIEEQLNKYNAVRSEVYKDTHSPEEVAALLENKRLETLEQIEEFLTKKGE
jgi:hypothetical protein